MPTSSYQADVKVEIAWDGGFRTPMADWTWTDVSSYVELAGGLSINWGRQDERSTADANTLSLTLDNRDGRFTAGKTGGAYYPDVVLYKPIRVLATPVDGSESERFTGYVTSWPVEWEGTDAYAKATVTASSRLARLGLNAQWRSLVEEEFLFDSPVAYYPLGDPEGSVMAADVSGNGAGPLVMVGEGTDVVFGQATGPPTDDLTAATFAGGKYLTAPTPIPSGTGIWIEAFVSTSGPVPATIMTVAQNTGDHVLTLALNPATGYPIALAIFPGGINVNVSGSVSIADGATHHLAARITWGSPNSTLELYLDGATLGTVSLVGVTSGVYNQINVGASVTGALAHAAVGNTALSAARFAAHATAGSSAFTGELTSVRLVRYAELAGIPTAEVDAETGTVTMTHVDITGGQVVDLLRLCETTEGGVLFDGRDGVLNMHNRGHRYTSSALFTLNMAEHEVEADYAPRLDASALTNDVTVTSPVTSAHLTDQDSIDAYGLATSSVEVAAEDVDEPLNFASWALLQFAEPKTRVPTLSVDALAQVGKTPNCAAVLVATVGDKLTVSNAPTQAQASSSDYFIEGGTEVYGPESLVVTFNVSPSSPDDTVLIVDDAVRGAVDTYAVAF